MFKLRYSISYTHISYTNNGNVTNKLYTPVPVFLLISNTIVGDK